MDEPEVGQRFTLTTDYGLGIGSLPAGAELEVLQVVPAGTPGAGAGDADARVLLQYQQPSIVLDGGTPQEGFTSRLLSLPLSVLEAITADVPQPIPAPEPQVVPEPVVEPEPAPNSEPDPEPVAPEQPAAPDAEVVE